LRLTPSLGELRRHALPARVS